MKNVSNLTESVFLTFYKISAVSDDQSNNIWVCLLWYYVLFRTSITYQPKGSTVLPTVLSANSKIIQLKLFKTCVLKPYWINTTKTKINRKSNRSTQPKNNIPKKTQVQM